MKEFKKHVSGTEKAVAVFLWLMVMFVMAVQMFFGGGVLALGLVLTICTVVYSLLIFIPEKYELGRDSLAVKNMVLNCCVTIPYESVLHIDTVGTFRGLKKEFDSVELIVKYRPQGKKRERSISIHATNVRDLFKLLQERCPNLIPELN